MANANQGLRSGNAFGRLQNIAYGQYDTQNIALKPGYLIRIRDIYHLVMAREPMVVDLWFSDTVNVGDAGSTLNGTDATPLTQYGIDSVLSYYDQDGAGAATVTGNILKPDYDSGFLAFKDLEPHAGNLYQLAPTLPLQPKFISTETGDWHSLSTTNGGPFAGGTPIGFKGASDASNDFSDPTQIGSVSPKVYIKHPAGVPKHVLDQAAEGSSGTVRSTTAIEGISGFVDGSMSPSEAPNWDYCLWIEHGENNLPYFKVVNDSDEYILDGRVRLVGWKYRVLQLTDQQLADIRQRAGGRLRFVIINSTGLPVSGSMLADYFPN